MKWSECRLNLGFWPAACVTGKLIGVVYAQNKKDIVSN